MCTMQTGLTGNLKDVSVARKTAVIYEDLVRLGVRLATIPETCHADSGTLKENDYTFFLQGKAGDEPRNHGAELAVKNSLQNMVEPVNREHPKLSIACLSNARVGADQDSYPSCFGHFGIGKMNENEQRLFELCSYHGQCVTNSYFLT